MIELMAQKAKEVFGSEYALVSMERLLGGAQKHTYLAKCSNGFQFVVYQWDKHTTYFERNENEIFCSSSAVLFEKNHEFMKAHDVLTPALFYMDRSRTETDCEYACVEYIDGADMDFIAANEPGRMADVIKSLTANINRLHSIKSASAGQVGNMQDKQFDVIAHELEDIHQNCVYLQEHDREYAELYIRAESKAIEIAKGLKKREEYTFIHSELGPNHVMVDCNNNAYLIDIEGARYYDVEEENSFLRFRFNNQLTGLNDHVDEKRMAFYHIGHCFGHLRGSTELKQKDYYDMDDVSGMIAFFQKQFEAYSLH